MINHQHIFNECTLYLLSVLLLLFSNYVEPEMRYILGFFLITVVFIFVIYNIIIMLLFSCRLLILIVKKQYYKLQRRKLGSQVKELVQELQVKIDEQDWFEPDPLSCKFLNEK